MQRVLDKVRRRLREAARVRAARAAPFALVHAPACYSRRAGDFTANIYGTCGERTRAVRYALNGGPYIDVRREPPRIPPHEFVIELPAAQLASGCNRIELQISEDASQVRSLVHEFNYADAAPLLPARIDWRSAPLEVGDGLWEVIERDGQGWLRPRPGHEHYDRTALAVGAFDGGRRIEVPLVYRSHRIGRPYAFGLHPLWGGRPDPERHTPRRGWNFSVAGYYSHYNGVGMEFSYRSGAADPDWVGVYRNFAVRADCEYRLVVEVQPQLAAPGKHVRYQQRMRFEPAASPESPWMELSDTQGAALPAGEYGIAVLAHSCQVEFGSVTVTNLPAVMGANVAEEASCRSQAAPVMEKTTNDR